jgi:hypothetical protein
MKMFKIRASGAIRDWITAQKHIIAVTDSE